VSAPLPAERCAAWYHGWAFAERLTRRGHSAPDTEDALFRERREQLFRHDPIVLQEMFQGPEGGLGVVGRKADRTTTSVSIRRILADWMSRVRKLPFGRIPSESPVARPSNIPSTRSNGTMPSRDGAPSAA
jgi:hypothetical protein